MKAKKLYYKECHLAGRKYYDVDEVWEELKVGTLLTLQRDYDNRHDHNAVAVMYKRRDELTGEMEEFHLGYIPRCENDDLAPLLEMGWGEIFECRISRIKADENYEEQIKLTIRILRNKRDQ